LLCYGEGTVAWFINQGAGSGYKED
jgi:hypothetical protein